MANYNFDELVKAATRGDGLYDKEKALTREEAEKALRGFPFRFSITDGYTVKDGGQFDYVFDFGKGTFDRSDWRKGLPIHVTGAIPAEAMENFVKAVSFVWALPQKQFVTNTKSLLPQTDSYEKSVYGPIKRLTRCELRTKDKFFRWVPEEDRDTPFPELYAALVELRKAVDGEGKIEVRS